MALARPRVLDAAHVATAARAADLPPPGPPELAFLGRSNVGKSSLLNRLAGRRALARTSGTPGKTRLIHVYRVELERGAADGARERLAVHLVDLPGYGYARVARREREGWQAMVEGYLEGRPTLAAAVLLQDVRRSVSEDETLLLAWLAERGIHTFVAVTKADKLKRMRRAAAVRALREALALPAERVMATSAREGTGMDALWTALLERVD